MPSASSIRVMPNDHTSDKNTAPAPMITSGAIHNGEPATVLFAYTSLFLRFSMSGSSNFTSESSDLRSPRDFVCPRDIEIPKSVSFTLPSCVRRTLPALRSRWTIFLAWRYWSAFSIPAHTYWICSSSKLPHASSRSRKDPPLQTSIMSHILSSGSGPAQPKKDTIFACLHFFKTATSALMSSGFSPFILRLIFLIASSRPLLL
mmetsp:Transcript_3974/g.6087  ORF Transcript_3974/g.6087 Transcript_3974/m.6087 type:complete len:204 (+) Transcript_3974:283-894(+)